VPREARVQDFSLVESVHLLGNSLDVTVAPNKMTRAGFKEGANWAVAQRPRGAAAGRS